MAVYYRFKSSTVKESIPIDGNFIAVRDLKEKIVSKKFKRGNNYDLIVMDSVTNEDYLDEGTLIHKCATVLIRRVPRRLLLPIVIAPPVAKPGDQVEDESGDVQTKKSEEDSSGMIYPEDLEWDEFVKDLCANSESLPNQSRLGNHVQDAAPPATVVGGDMSGRMMEGRRGRIPPKGYVCHRCKVPGHFIQHCSTNGDRDYDVKRFKRPTGIPKSMLMTSTDGSYALPSGAVADLKPNEAVFEKEIEGLPSSRNSLVDLPPELHCPLCKHVMKDAVFTSKCCFKSFCDKCIREHIITKSMCLCGATDVLADYLLPNKTLRDTINRMLESDYSSGKSSGKNSGSTSRIQPTESCYPKPGVPSSTHSAASKRDQVPPPTQKEETLKAPEVVEQGEAVSAPQKAVKKMRLEKVASTSEAMDEPESVTLTQKEVQQKVVASREVAKRKKKNTDLASTDAEMQWRSAQNFPPENYVPVPATYNPYWTGMNSFMPPYAGVVDPYIGYGVGPLNIPFGGPLPNHPFGGQGYTTLFGHFQSGNIADVGMESNARPPSLIREELEARKPHHLKRKRESERCGESQKLPKHHQDNGMLACLL